MAYDLVSVIIPVYNRQDTVRRAIDSVLSQTYPNIELIIVDDVSTDHSVEVIRSYHDDRVRLICQKEHGGANRARNTGITNARGEYIAFQDSDDEWLPDKLMIQIEYMKSRGCDACYSAYYSHIGDDMKIIPLDHGNKEKHEKNLKESLRRGNSIGTPTLVIDKNVFGRMPEKGFDEKLPRLQDYDFAIRLAQNASIAYIETPTVHAYKSDNSISKNDDFLFQAISILLKKHRGFIDEKSLFDVTLDSRTYHQDLDEVVESLNYVQQYIPENVLNCKDELIMHMLKLVRKQNQLLVKHYENVIERVENQAFVIYGAGDIGKKIYKRLLKRNVRPSCFLVTKKGNENYIDDIPIYTLDEYSNKEQLIIVGVDERLQNELVDNLVRRGFLSFCIYQREK